MLTMHLSQRAKALLNGTVITKQDLLDLLTEKVELFTQREVAENLGVSNGYLGDVLHGRRPVSEAMAARLGWKRVAVFVRSR